MNPQLLRSATATLLTEICDGQPDPKRTWVVSNEAGSRVLGTVGKLSVQQATHRPPGVTRCVAEHVAHIVFALRTSLRYAQGDMSPADWDSSWEIGKLDEAGWKSLQEALRQAYQDLLAWNVPDEAFGNFDVVCGYCGTVAHAAYHLGAIRQLALLSR
jgi:DinB superfamily